MLEDRIKCKELREKIITADEAAMFFKTGMNVGTSGFTPAGYPKAVPLALAKRRKRGDKIEMTLMTGASVGDELDGTLSRAGIIKRRYPYQTNSFCRNNINSSQIEYCDMHLGSFPQWIKYDFMGHIDIALVEAIAIREDGGIIPSTSVGNSNIYIEKAEKVVIELNISQPLELEGIHDIYSPDNPPFRKEIPIYKSGDRIGTTYIPCNPNKIVGIVITDIKDANNELAPIDNVSTRMAENLIDFLDNEVKCKRLPENLLPLQSGVGSVANAVLAGLVSSKYENLTVYSEVLQDAVLDLIDCGKVDMASATSLTLSKERIEDFYNNIKKYKEKIILRPQEISNNSEIIRRLGVIGINTAIEVDLYGNVNSSNVLGSRIINGIGGSGDFARNSYLSIFVTQTTAKNGDISCIVPMVSHCDHTEHDVQVIVTEQGVADLRGLSPKERAKTIIENCTYGEYKEMLKDYYNRSLSECKYKHIPHLIGESLSWHKRFSETGTMKIIF
ncbi:acetyl-CoA hydrolase/transferase family protein [Schnuerera ultunensis]|uniref:Succinyl-CoA:coenzyme A transferase n=1 Tax=[Clostridium] ultunense Esp TaxID=1288971 RepID=A0A1M4PT69_9FIRM|nr:acetyl-CoA hydrolase/transferase family protein [Schnuerera ultunensis]SHD78686.1 Succinyl-CoA:coenzyme A transferase [[Clostridium] ultunense Esp]